MNQKPSIIGAFFLLMLKMPSTSCMNRINMLWTIRYEWPASARLIHIQLLFSPRNTYICRTPDGTSSKISSEEGITQSRRPDTLAMIIYGDGLMPMVRQLKEDHPSVVQTWYADDAGSI